MKNARPPEQKPNPEKRLELAPELAPKLAGGQTAESSEGPAAPANAMTDGQPGESTRAPAGESTGKPAGWPAGDLPGELAGDPPFELTAEDESWHAEQQAVRQAARQAEERRQHERKRRRKEILLAGAATLLVLGLGFFQTTQVLSGGLFLAIFNLNVVILLGILFVVLRNGLKLLLERRRGVLGSRLRTRLILSFTAMTLVPCLFMFLVTAQFVKQSVDFWFKTQVETSMENALEVARNAYDKTGKRLRSQAEYALEEIQNRRFIWGGKEMTALLEQKNREYGLAISGALTPDLEEKIWFADSSIGGSWLMVKNSISWGSLKEQGYTFMLGNGPFNDFMYGVLAVDEGKTGYLVLGEDMGAGFKSRLDAIVAGNGEYKNLRNIKRGLKDITYVTLAILTALITMSTIWFAFKVAKEFSSPIMEMVEATGQVAKGDLSVRLHDLADDEMGLLARSFNKMTEDLGRNRKELTDANQRLAEQNLSLDQHRRYVETVLNNITAGVVTFDAAWNITTVNNAACSILGLNQHSIIGRNIAEIIPPQYFPLTMEIGKRLQRRPQTQVQRQFTLHMEEGEKRLLLTAVALPFGGEENYGCLGVFEDITELEKMQRMSAWREVARRIAHEIKNPLTPIKLSAQRLERKFSGVVNDPVFVQSTQLIVREVEHLQNMVLEFSNFAKIPEIKPEAADLTSFLQELVETFGNSHSNIHWQLDLPTEVLPKVNLDKEAMHRAMLNILTNAAEALEGRAAPQVKIAVSLLPALDMVRIRVSDNGPGLTEEERQKMFEPYFSRKKGGTGLGLPIVKSIITDHYGAVRASRSDSGGLTLTIDLPAAAATA